MGEFYKAELKDRFLKYALDRRDYFEAQSLYDEFLHPNYSLNFVKKLVKDIQDYDSSLLDIMGGNGVEIFMLASTEATSKFLEGGGFKEMFVKEEEKWDVFLDQLDTNRNLSNDEKELLKKHAPKNKKEKTLLLILISAIAISFVFTLLSILSALLEPEYVPADEFERKLEQIHSQHKQENQSLRTELERTQQMVDSLKSKSAN